MKTPKVVMIDIDGVLVDFVGGFMTLANEMFGVPVHMTLSQETWRGFGLTHDQEKQIWEKIWSDPYFWQRLECLPTRQDFLALENLLDECLVYFVTDRKGVNVMRQTKVSLCSLFFPGLEPNVIISKHKGIVAQALKADFALDDKASNASCIAWLTADATKSFLLNRRYNQVPRDFLASSVVRVDSMFEFAQRVND